MFRRIVLLAVAAAVIAAHAAHARDRSPSDDPSVVVARGDHVSVATEPDGTAHVVWAMRVRGTEFNAVGYCRMPSGELRCDKRQTLLVLDPQTAADAMPAVHFQAPSTVTILDARCCDSAAGGRYAIISTDHGDTFQTYHPTNLQAPTSPYRHDRLSVLRNDGTLVVIGGSNSTFGLATYLHSTSVRSNVLGVEQVSYTPFAQTGSEVVYATDLNVLGDGRLIAIGQHRDVPTVAGIWSRVQRSASSDPNDATAWTPWRRVIADGYPEAVAAPGTGPTTLVYLTVNEGFALHLATVTTTGVNSARLLSGSVGVQPTRDPSAAAAAWDHFGRLHVVWTSEAEGCPRLHRCLLYRRTMKGGAFGPKEILRSLPSDGANAVWQPALSAERYRAVAAWVERRDPVRAVGEVRVARVGCLHSLWTCDELLQTEGSGALVAPVGLVTRRSFTARVLGGIRHQPFNKVIFTLIPPRCVHNDSGCLTLRKPVVVTDEKAPFQATFSGLPNQATITSTTDPLKNRLCETQPYVYSVRATLFTARNGRLSKQLVHHVSYCPLLR